MRFHQALRLFTFCASPLLAFGQQIDSPQPQPVGIIGTVTDIQNDAIPAASVVLVGPAPADHSAVTADDHGFFAFKNLRPAVPYRLAITANGFAKWTSPVVILTPSQSLDLGDVKLSIAVVQTTVTAVSTQQIATEEIHIEEKQRVLGVVPNFYVVYTPNPAPLTKKLKYQLALRDMVDPIKIAGTAFYAGVNQAADTPDFQQGAKGYAQRFGAAYADGFTDTMIGGAILPSLLHQDPRYFYQGTGTTGSRVRHALGTVFLCKGDNGRNQFNYSSIGGDLASGALSNLYYPSSDRGVGIVFDSALISAAGRAADALAQEFILRKLTSSAKKQP
jgi:hypothetical protein